MNDNLGYKELHGSVTKFFSGYVYLSTYDLCTRLRNKKNEIQMEYNAKNSNRIK